MVWCACLQVEESYISADSFKEKVGVEVKMLLKTEVPLLQGLGFDLVVYSPYRALHGLFQVRQDTLGQEAYRGRAASAHVPDHSPCMHMAAGGHSCVQLFLVGYCNRVGLLWR